MLLSKSRTLFGLEFAFSIFALLLLSDALNPFLTGFYSIKAEGGDLTESNPVRLLTALAVYVVALGFVIYRPKISITPLLRRPDVLLLVALPLLSAAWSFDFVTIMRRALAHSLMVVFCLYIVTRFTPEEMLRRLVIAFALGIFGSLLLCIVFPGFGIERGTNAGAWAGLYGHKATTGRVCVLAVFAAFLWVPKTPGQSWFRWATFGGALLLAVLSQSRASWVLIVGGFFLVGVLKLVRLPRVSFGLKVSAALAFVVILIVGGLASYQPILAAMGRDMTFSGRTSLWHAAIQVANDAHPVFGSGYRAFWIGPDAEGVKSYVARSRLPYHGHNGYLDLWLELGWFGVASVIAFAVTSLTFLGRCIVTEPSRPVWTVMTCFFVMLLFNNVAVSVVLRHTDLAWMLALCAALYASEAITARKSARMHPAAATAPSRSTDADRPASDF